MEGFLVNWITAFPNFAAPLLLACMGLIICERAGVLNLGAEGLMVVGAMFSVMIIYNGGGILLGVCDCARWVKTRPQPIFRV